MCGRFTINKPEKIKVRFKTTNKLPLFKPNYNVTPNSSFPVITRNSPNKVSLMYWGFIPEWGKDTTGLINIRAETALDKPYFTKKLMSQRCLIPASGFYEWGTLNLEGKDERYPFYFFLPDEELFSFAGIYNEIDDEKATRKNSFAILTCPPNDMVAKVHNRMPVIIDKKDEDKWLDANTTLSEIKKLLVPYSADKMKHYPVSRRVNNPVNNDPSLINKLE